MRLFIEILNRNEILQNIFCEKYNFNPVGNIIIINWFPERMKEHLSPNINILSHLKAPQKQTTNKYWMWPFNPRYNDDYFPDPKKYLIGFYYNNKSALSQSSIISQEESKFYIDELMTKLELEESKEDQSKGSFSFDQAAGSGSESATKMRNSSIPRNKIISLCENKNSKEEILSARNSVNQKGKFTARTPTESGSKKQISQVVTKVDRNQNLNLSKLKNKAENTYSESTNVKKTKQGHSKSIESKNIEKYTNAKLESIKSSRKSPLPSNCKNLK